MRDLSKHIGKTKGVLTIVDIVKSTENNKHSVAKCLCSRCGQYSEVSLDRFTAKVPYAKYFCINCKDSYYLEKAKEKFIGKKNGVLECLDVVNSEDGKRKMAICKCYRCGNITQVRTERLLKNGKYTPQSCDKCVNDLYRETTKARYYKEYGCEGEEYESTHHDAERIRSIKQGAKDRDINYALTNWEAKELLHKECYYCGKPHADGIDRIDSNGSYFFLNCVPCCSTCNIMKNKFDKNTFFEHIKLIYERHFKDK